MLAQILNSKFIFPPAGAAFISKYSYITTNRLISNIPLKTKNLMSTLISKIAYSLEKHQKTQKSRIFLCSRPKMAVFQIFQDTFFCGPLISIQEGLVKSLIIVPPLFAAETELFGPSYGCPTTSKPPFSSSAEP